MGKDPKSNSEQITENVQIKSPVLMNQWQMCKDRNPFSINESINLIRCKF